MWSGPRVGPQPPTGTRARSTGGTSRHVVAEAGVAGEPERVVGRLHPEAEGRAAQLRERRPAVVVGGGQHLDSGPGHVEHVTGGDGPHVLEPEPAQQLARAVRRDHRHRRGRSAGGTGDGCGRRAGGTAGPGRPCAASAPRRDAVATEVEQPVDQDGVGGDADPADLHGRGRVAPPGDGEVVRWRGHGRMMTGRTRLGAALPAGGPAGRDQGAPSVPERPCPRRPSRGVLETRDQKGPAARTHPRPRAGGGEEP